MMPSAQLVAAGSSMLRAARRCSRESSDIFARIPSTPSTRCGRGSAASKNGTATNGANVFPITRTVVEPDASGPRTIFSGAAGGVGSFRCRAMVGDAAGFIDPLYSPGLDFCSYTSYYVADLLARSLKGEDVTERLHHYNQQYPVTYRSWFESLYKDKYYYMGDADLTSAALLLDVSSYYAGLVRRVYRDPECAFLNLPFTGRGGRFARNVMNFYNRRLVALANRRWATGYYGKRNAGWRELYDGFVPDRRLRKQISRGLRRWLKCELINLTLMLRRPVIRANEGSAGIHTQVSTTTASTGAGSSALS